MMNSLCDKLTARLNTSGRPTISADIQFLQVYQLTYIIRYTSNFIVTDGQFAQLA